MALAKQATNDAVGPSAQVDQAEIDTLMRRFFDQNRAQNVDSAAPEVPATVAPNAPPRRNFDMASELLDRASEAFDVLLNRCQRLEQDLDEANESAKAQAAERGEALEQWKRLAAGLKQQLEASMQATAALKTRCDAAEARATMADQRTTALERASAQAAGHAALAESLSTKLHDKVVSAFGIGSRAHPVLEAVATQQAAE